MKELFDLVFEALHTPDPTRSELRQQIGNMAVALIASYEDDLPEFIEELVSYVVESYLL